jgi:hypothetical protein
MGFIVAAIIVAWFAGVMATFIMALERNPWVWGLACAALIIAGLGAFFEVTQDANQKGPCVQYETQMHYNAATKTMMPARVCVLRGEWVEE